MCVDTSIRSTVRLNLKSKAKVLRIYLTERKPIKIVCHCYHTSIKISNKKTYGTDRCKHCNMMKTNSAHMQWRQMLSHKGRILLKKQYALDYKIPFFTIHDFSVLLEIQYHDETELKHLLCRISMPEESGVPPQCLPPPLPSTALFSS